MLSARKLVSLPILLMGVAVLLYELLVDFVFFMFVGVNVFSVQVALEDPLLWLSLAAILGAAALFRAKTFPDPKQVFGGRRRTGAAVLAGPLLIVGVILVILVIVGGLVFLWLLATSPILQLALGVAIVILAGAAALILYTKARYG